MNIYPVKITSISDQARLFAGNSPVGDYQDRTFIQQSGFTSHPPARAFGIVLVEDNACYLISTSDDQKPSVPNERDTAIYSDADKYVMVKADGDIEIANNNNKITLRANGDIELGSGTLQKLLNKAAMDIYNVHTHTLDIPHGLTCQPVPLMVEDTHTTTKVKGE
jgi:hypothetical protein